MKEKIKNLQFKYLIYILSIIIFNQQIHKISSLECTSLLPLIKNNECVSRCTTDEIKSKICIVYPEHSKYYLTNIIVMGSKNSNHTNIKSNKNNDIVIQVSVFNGTSERLFYGYKSNGRFLFRNENQEELQFLNIDVTGEDMNQRFEGDSSFIQLSNDDSSNNEEEYFINIGNGEQYTELLDFQNKEYSIIKTTDFLGEIYSYKGTIIKLSKVNDEDKNYYLIAVVNKYDNNEYKINMKKIYFSSKTVDNSYSIVYSEYINCTENKMISCFQTKLNKIICFYRDINEEDNSTYYYIGVYECCFSQITSYKIAKSESANLFYKGIHLKEEIGVFSYFENENNNYDNKPFFSFKYFDPETSEIKNYSSYGNIEIIIQGIYDYNIMLNDLIKISDTNICYISSPSHKTNLYFIIFTLYNNDEKLEYKIKYDGEPFNPDEEDNSLSMIKLFVSYLCFCKYITISM